MALYVGCTNCSSKCVWVGFCLSLATSLTKVYRNTHTYIGSTSFIECRFTWDFYIKYPRTQPNLLWSFKRLVNSLFSLNFVSILFWNRSIMIFRHFFSWHFFLFFFSLAIVVISQSSMTSRPNVLTLSGLGGGQYCPPNL